MQPPDLQKHIYATYFSLRMGLAALAFAFPVLLVAIGLRYGLSMQGSMSAYYFAFEPITSDIRAFPMRGWFVGILFALGCFLYLYKGFSRTENWVLNAAGACALIVALIPMQAPDYCKNCGSDSLSWLHGTFAVLLFLCVGFVAWACTEETLVQLDKPTRDRLRNGYYVLAGLMIVLPLAIVAMTYVLGSHDRRIFWVEFAGIWTFAAYWSLKSYELGLSKADKKAMLGQMPTADAVVPPAEKASLRMRAARVFD
jgi:hypothetical protein